MRADRCFPVRMLTINWNEYLNFSVHPPKILGLELANWLTINRFLVSWNFAPKKRQTISTFFLPISSVSSDNSLEPGCATTEFKRSWFASKVVSMSTDITNECWTGNDPSVLYRIKFENWVDWMSVCDKSEFLEWVWQTEVCWLKIIYY